MAVILQVTGGPAAGRKTFLRAGQVLRIGRTEYAEFTIAQDPSMAPVHFSLEFDSRICRLRDLQGAGTLVNGRPMSDGVVSHGDRITAGGTTFSVLIDGQGPITQSTPASTVVMRSAPASAAAPTIASGFALIATPLAATVCQQFELDEELKPQLGAQDTVRQFFHLLSKSAKPGEAVRLLAHALPKREAVFWACQCLRSAGGDKLPPRDRAALGAAESWVREPSESNRRAAQGAADATGFETAAGWAAGAAFWSGGSIAPEGLPDVPPKETLTPQAVVVALTLLANADLAKAPQKYNEFLNLGARIADGQLRPT